ncbi:MAG: helix-turn-helix transcriptional regulator [Planctomycetes bacterium]|nr:helix-turn-helix transcriptional regulator [Planctomycetota bacterium]
MGCFRTRVRTLSRWHIHECDELCLVSGSGIRLGHAGAETKPSGETLYIFRRGEQHGYWNDSLKEPYMWVLHYRPDEALYRECPSLVSADPSKRILRLDAAQAAAFKSLFVKVLAEHRQTRTGSAAASSAWLRLLLVSVARWCGTETRPKPAAAPQLSDQPIDAEVLALWHLVNDHVSAPADLAGVLKRRVVNYDSLRHRFRKAFNASPMQLLMALRMERAKNLLLESSDPIAEIARLMGYARQHEFTRAFHRAVGCTPTRWREQAAAERRDDA